MRRFGLFHQLDFLVLDLEDRRLAGVDFVGERAVFLILPGLELLVGIPGDHLLFAVDFQLEIFAGRFDLFDTEFGILQLGLDRGGFGLECLPLRLDAGQLALLPADFLVAVLQDQQLFNRFLHVRNSNKEAGYPASGHKSTRGISKRSRPRVVRQPLVRKEPFNGQVLLFCPRCAS